MARFPKSTALKSMLKKVVKSASRQMFSRTIQPTTGLSPHCWGLEYRDDQLVFKEHQLSELLSTWGSPLHIIDEAKLIDNLKGFQTVPTGYDRGVDIFYSYKTNPLPWVFEVLHRHGAGAEVISEYELWLALKLGVSPSRIIYNGPAKSQASLETAIAQEILSINLNHLEEIDLVAELAAKQHKTANVGIRIVAASGWTGQFGLSIETGSAMAAFKKALSMPQLNLTTLHCHRGNLIDTEATLLDHLTVLLDFVDRLYQAFGWTPKIFDIGGSLAVPTVRYLSKQEMKLATTFLVPPAPPNPESVLTPRDYADIVVKVVRDRFRERGYPQPQIVAEPGRSLTGNSQLMLASVLNVRRDREFDFAVLDAGINLASCVTSEYHEVFPLKRQGAPLRCHRLVGPICHMGDTLYMARYLPPLERHDAIAIMDSGAYFIADATSFSFPQPAVIAIAPTGDITPVRQAESFEHLVSLDRFGAATANLPATAGDRTSNAACS